MMAFRYCFTINNYTQETIDTIAKSHADVTCLAYSHEVGASGTPHLQGYVEFRIQWRRNRAEKLLGGHAWLEACKGTRIDNFVYIGKTSPIVWIVRPADYEDVPSYHQVACPALRRSFIENKTPEDQIDFLTAQHKKRQKFFLMNFHESAYDGCTCNINDL